MDSRDASLPGLDRLLAVLQQYGVGADPFSSVPGEAQTSQFVLGDPVDPLLAALYKRFNGGRFGELLIFKRSGEEGLESWTAMLRRFDSARLPKLLCYGALEGFGWYLATAPSLAAAGGVQPVVFLDSHDDKPILPIASSVDRAFNLYASYCEACLKQGLALDDPESDVFFPRSFAGEVAQDRALVGMLSAGRFDELAITTGSREWVRQVLAEAQS